MIDQCIGRGVVAVYRGVGMQFGQDAPGELLAELDAPLVVGIQVPDHALDKDLVLVQRDQHAERMRRELLQQDRIARMVAVEYLLRNKAVGLRRRFLARTVAQLTPIKV